MSKLPDAVPCPDKPPLHLKGGYLCVAAPVDFTEACFSAPAVRALRSLRPQSTLFILCPESQESVWKTMEECNGVIVYPDNASARQIVKILKSREVDFESAISWEAGEAAKAFARAKILQRLGYPAAGLGKYLTDVVEVVLSPGPISHRVRHYLNFVQNLGGDAFVKEHFETPALAFAPETIRIALSPGSEYGLSYRWPLEKMKEVVDVINGRYDGVEWVILGRGGNQNRDDVGAELEGMLETEVKNYSMEWGREKTMHALRYCSALLACDGELAHLAAHVGLPTVVIFGPNEPEWKRPLGKQSRVVREHVACSPCYLSRCPIDHRCQNEVTVEMVVAELETALVERYASR
jgi:heptosyltransferase-2